MFFNDDFNKRKVNMGNYSLTSKDDFLKKMEEEEKKAKNQKKIDGALKIIKNFFNKNFSVPPKTFKESKLINNLNSVIKLLEGNSYPKDKKEKLAILSIKKVSDDLLNMLNCRGLSNKILFELIHTVSEILSFSTNESVAELFIGEQQMKYAKIFFKLIKASFYELYFNVKKKYLIDEKNNVFAYIYYLNYVFPNDIKKIIYKSLSENASFLFVLKNILEQNALIISKYSKEILLEFCGNISTKIINKRKINGKYIFNRITYKFLEELLYNFITNSFVDIHNDNKYKSFINIFDIFCNLDESSFSIFENHNNNNLIYIFDYISSEVEIKLKNKSFLMNQNQNYFNLFIQIFKNITEIDLIGYNNAIFLKKLSDILEYIFISYQMNLEKEKYKEIRELLNKDENVEQVKKILKLIFYSVRVLEVLYMSSSEKKNNQILYDYLVNKVIVKSCPNIAEIILNYTVRYLKIKYPRFAALDSHDNNNSINNYNNNKIIIKRNETSSEIQEKENIFEVISYIVLNKINYRANFFFVEFKTTNNIYENLPFNYLFLNLFSKYLISLFSSIIEKTKFDDLSLFSENMIILCLKGLYLLDGDINFTPNREEFWNNMELVSKISSTDKILLLEQIKLIPFIFPLKIRLDMGLREINRSKIERNNSIRNMRNNMNYYGFDQDLYEEDIENVQIKIPRESIFNTTFMYYMQNMLSPNRRWIITFIDKLGQVEQGVDAGGLYKEFMYKLSEEAFSSKLGYFEESETGLLLPTRDAVHVDKNYNYSLTYEFLGFIVAKAIADNIKIFPNFSPVFLNNCLEIENSFIDLKTYDPELYKNLVTLKTYEGDVENDLGLYFSLTIEKNGKNVTFDLIDGGNNIPVNNENRLTYIKKVTDYYLTYQFKETVHNFTIGMSRVINMDILRLYTGDELRQIIYGFDKDVFTVGDMQLNSNFIGFDMQNPKEAQCINDFLKILDEFTQKEKEKFLFFCTSLKRLPIGGFSKLRPKFTVTKSFSAVPTSSTCVNMLKLPILPYKKLKEILLYVINADAGFYYA